MNLTFEKHNFLEKDVNKKNVLLVLSQINTREYTYGYVFPLIQILKEKFNIYIFFEGSKKTIDEFNLFNVYRLNGGHYSAFKDAVLKRKVERSDSDFYNQNIIDTDIEKFLMTEPKFNAVIVIDNHNLMLPFNPLSKHPELKGLFNDYFDSFNDDKEIDDAIDETTNHLFNPTSRGISPLAFRYSYKNIMLSFIEQIHKKDDAFVHVILIDPSAGIPFFKFKNIKHKFWYYADDKRHRRNFHQFQFTELQHLVYEPHWKGYSPDKKTLLDQFDESNKIPFFFAGSLLNDKGLRKYIWQDFFKDFSYAKSELYFKVSLIYGMDKNSFEKLKKEVELHPQFLGNFMPNEEYLLKLKKCKTGFIARNVSANLGLTFRHIQYLYFNVLPIFDYLYDVDYLWIPKEFQDKLTVKNSTELYEIVKFYDENEKERISLLNEMKEYYKINEWLTNWEQLTLETNLIKELYEN